MSQDADLVVKATQQGFPETKEAVRELRQEVAATNVESGAATEASALKGEAGLAALRAEMKATADQAGALAAGEEAAASSSASFGTGLAGVALPLTAVAIAIPVVLELLKKLAELFENAAAGSRLLSQDAADAALQQYALAQGFVVATDNLAKNQAAIELHRIALHNWTIDSDAARVAFEAFGFKLPTTFNEATQAATAFLDAYKGVGEKGSAYAQAFLELNKSTLAKIGDAFAELGEEAPAEIQKLADAVGVDLLGATAKTEASIKKLTESLDGLKAKQKDLTQSLAESSQAFKDQQTQIEANRQAAIAAVEATTAKTVADLQKQIDATKAAYAAREISDTDYNTRINTLVADQAKVRDEAYAAEVKIDQDAAKKSAEKTAKLQEETTKQAEAQKKVADAIADQEEKLKRLVTAQEAQIDAFTKADPILASVEETVANLGKSQGLYNAQLVEAATAISGILGPVRELSQELATSASNARALAAALDAVTGGSGDQGSGETPESFAGGSTQAP